MAKINRISGDFKAFGSAAVGTERTVFGGVTQSDILNDNITASFLRGWGIVGVNENPTKQDFNALGFTLSQVLAYLHQQGVASWDTLQEYNADAITTKSGVIYISQSDANIGNDPATDSGANWMPVSGGTAGLAGAAPEVAAGRTNSVKRADGSWSERVRHLYDNYPLQTWGDDLALGAYDVNLTVAQNGLPSGWWYIEVMRHISDISANQFRYLRATPLDAPLTSRYVYHCSVVGGAWSAWTNMSAVPVGAAMPFFGGTVHVGFLKANGAAVSRTSYAALFAEIGTMYGAGNGSTTFNLPDSRGEFLRGWDDARGVDAGRVLGSWQADDFKSHMHTGEQVTSGAFNYTGAPSHTTITGSTGATGGTETRPRNLAVQFLIKY